MTAAACPQGTMSVARKLSSRTPCRQERKRKRAEERAALREAERRERWRQRKMLSLVDELGLDRPGEAGGSCSDGARCGPWQSACRRLHLHHVQPLKRLDPRRLGVLV